MRIESLQYFVTTADCKSMTLSSQVLHISQQNISKEIKKLENELGVQLFRRSKSGVALTPEGQKAYQAASQLLEQLRRFAHLFSSAPSTPPQITLSIYGAFRPHLDALLQIYQSIWPNIVTEDYYCSTEQIETAIHSATADFILYQKEFSSDAVTPPPRVSGDYSLKRACYDYARQYARKFCFHQFKR